MFFFFFSFFLSVRLPQTLFLLLFTCLSPLRRYIPSPWLWFLTWQDGRGAGRISRWSRRSWRCINWKVDRQRVGGGHVKGHQLIRTLPHPPPRASLVFIPFWCLTYPLLFIYLASARGPEWNMNWLLLQYPLSVVSLLSWRTEHRHK